jgi:hypothetical protein
MFPSILKGSDLYLYCVFVALGLEVDICPVIEKTKYKDRWGKKAEDSVSGGGVKENVWVGGKGCGTGAVET